MKNLGRAAGAAIVVMAKVPLPGRVKTRLIGALTREQSAALHLACLHDTLRLTQRMHGTRKYLFLGGTTREVQDTMARLGRMPQWRVAQQTRGDLGARMAHAIRRATRDGATRIVVIGTDTPWMRTTGIREAIEALSAHDVVLGPCRDGGYYLLAVRRLVPQILAGIDWGTRRVLRQTLRAAKHAGVMVKLLPVDFDVDRPADLVRVRRLCRRPEFQNLELCRWLQANPPAAQSSRRQPPLPPSRTRQPDRG